MGPRLPEGLLLEFCDMPCDACLAPARLPAPRPHRAGEICCRGTAGVAARISLQKQEYLDSAGTSRGQGTVQTLKGFGKTLGFSVCLHLQRPLAGKTLMSIRGLTLLLTLQGMNRLVRLSGL